MQIINFCWNVCNIMVITTQRRPLMDMALDDHQASPERTKKERELSGYSKRLNVRGARVLNVRLAGCNSGLSQL